MNFLVKTLFVSSVFCSLAQSLELREPRRSDPVWAELLETAQITAATETVSMHTLVAVLGWTIHSATRHAMAPVRCVTGIFAALTTWRAIEAYMKLRAENLVN